MANGLFDNVYNPDVLSCLANLSSDEVFTPPDVVNQMLDMLPQELFESPDTTFLDPACKTGVFLREIAKRMLEKQVPNYKEMLTRIDEKKKNGVALSANDELFMEVLQERIDHIFHKQLFGIAITELTSLLSRRGVYCSKYPNSDFSVTRFENAQGNIRYKRIQHTWRNGNCAFCGANQKQYERGEELETHAYELIHTQQPEAIFNMKFDVIISNPPYQLSDGGHGASAMPIYQKFIRQAKKLSPRYLTMIVPSRWFTGGRGLDDFRDEMLHDDRIRVINDYPDASDCFPGVEIKGGVSFFLWDRDNRGDCKVLTHYSNGPTIESVRPLLEKDMNIFIRDSRQIDILHKIQAKGEKQFIDIMSANDPFGYDVRVENSYLRVKPKYEMKPFKGSCEFYYWGWRDQGVGYIDRSTARKGDEYIDKYKVMVPRAWGIGNIEKDKVNPFIGAPNSVCTETYTVIGPFETQQECENVVSYINTKFFHFLVSIVKITQAAAKHVYKLIPIQDFSHKWNDKMLYKKYNLSKDEIDFIENSVWASKEVGGEEDE